MRGLRSGAVLAFLGAIAVACSGSSTSIGGSDGGGNPAGCPGARPSSGAPCDASGLQCAYGCNVKATCDGRKWSVVELAIACPADAGAPPDGPTNCGTNADCPSLLSCSPGGTPSGCGICARPQNPCANDTDCTVINDAAPPKPMVCAPGGPCICPFGGKSGECIAACQGPSDCGADQACSPTGHCVAKPCSNDAECPSTKYVDYACSASGVCAVKSCKTTADCGVHFCVNGTCYPQQGTCVPPVG